MNVIAIKNTVLAVLAACGTWLAHALGGWDASMQVLIALMVADYVTGVLVAAVWHKSTKSTSGALDSKAGFKGLLKKCMILVLVMIGVLLDQAMGTEYIRMMVVIFFIGNEGISLLENLGLMGVPYPEFLRKALEALHEQGNQGKQSE